MDILYPILTLCVVQFPHRLLTLHWLESIASSRPRLRLNFSALGRVEFFDRGNDEDEWFSVLLEQSLNALIPGKCVARLALHILNNVLRNRTFK